MNSRDVVDFVVTAVNRRDFAAIERSGVMHPEMEFHSVVSRAEGSFYRGVDGLREWAAMVDDMWDGFTTAVRDVRAASGDRALVLLHLTGTARASGVPLDVPAAQIWEWRDGLLWRNIAYSDHDQALRDAGLA